MPDAVIVGNLRHEKLIKEVNDKGYVSVEELAELLDVSAQTIRRDIKKLSEQKLVVRHHGGAGRSSSVVNLDYAVRQVSETEEKEAIGAAIAEHIPDNSSVFISIGTTTEIIAKHLLKKQGLRVITNSLRVANVLYQKNDFNVMVPGGKLRSTNGGIVGSTALEFVNHFRVDYLITSCGSIDTDGTLLDYDFNEVVVVQSMMKTARNVFIAADSTKFSTTAAVEVGHIKNATALFTDATPPADINMQLTQHGVKLVIV
ncbi:DeoR/GlpR family DNA-binding transcription regulator [Pseudovibrio exalbescens]|uniref:DeoR family transcriptional regulator n=1 Tax=Pseudovibrio exalbescens TaxID=197461 RepID=A0A1U7JM39_9HYPH|nr:DeoR/GlpR family DNA-binding transcription regulator [Pseudovibrio exalbescens]OKL45816.1 DeoR family transcriptional regulator [Pseudovibrio exalbescens]